MTDTLKFKVAPHIVQDLGLNLYTELPRVLVEFVANAYDADADGVEITLDRDVIKNARDAIRKEYKSHQITAGSGPAVRMADRTLPDNITIVIQDDGHGMSRSDLDTKFLVAGRRRRYEKDGDRSPEKRRPVMGRKGLGKLAGFGVAKIVKVISRKKGEPDATEITLDYDELIKFAGGDEIPIPVQDIPGGAGLPATGGTRVELSRLVYEPTKSALDTITNAIGDHFVMINPADFSIKLNGQPVPPTERNFDFAYPEVETAAVTDLVEHTLDLLEGGSVKFRYRVRFTKRGEHLTARERGVRVYASKRLASAPDLLDVNTGVHGFRNTEYMDAVVEADFIDEDPTIDYIATDRHSLRWEVSPLSELRDFLSKTMMDAIREYQKHRDLEAPKEASDDKWTKEIIGKYAFPSYRRKTAFKIAAILADSSEKGVKGKDYKQHLEIFLNGLSQGEIIQSLSDLAKTSHPGITELVGQIGALTHREYSEAAQYVNGKIQGIEALSKLVVGVDFKKAKNEAELHKLLKGSPWLLGTSFNQMLASDRPQQDVLVRLEKYLEVGAYVPSKYDSSQEEEAGELRANKRPDLVFTMTSSDRNRVVIVELKAPNTPLHMDHLLQLNGYILDVQEWLEEHQQPRVQVTGLLVGSFADPGSKAEKVRLLRNEVKKRKDGSEWDVLDLTQVLDRTRIEHKDLLEVYQRIAQEDEE